MSILAFMPWCRIDKTYESGGIQILPFERDAPVNGLDTTSQDSVKTILAAYKTIQGKPIDRAALVRLVDKSVVADLNAQERAALRETLVLACFSALAYRDHFNLVGRYANGDCFALYFQRFDQADFTAITTRRKEGQILSGWPMDEITITIPLHCHTVDAVSLDGELLKALTSRREKAEDDEWGRWQNALTCFNQANTDSDNIRHQVEWVLLCSAFEHILEANSDARDVAARFVQVVTPSESILVSDAARRSPRWNDSGQALRYEWMREFYRIRGDFAHGRLNTQQPMEWTPDEHLVLAAIAFPLLVRCLLEKAGTYGMQREYRAQIEAFEMLANTPDFLRPPADQKGSLDSNWERCCRNAKSRLRVQQAVRLFESRNASETQ